MNKAVRLKRQRHRHGHRHGGRSSINRSGGTGADRGNGMTTRSSARSAAAAAAANATAVGASAGGRPDMDADQLRRQQQRLERTLDIPSSLTLIIPSASASSSADINANANANANASITPTGSNSNSGNDCDNGNENGLQMAGDGVSPLAFGAEARPIRTVEDQEALEARERAERERRWQKERREQIRATTTTTGVDASTTIGAKKKASQKPKTKSRGVGGGRKKTNHHRATAAKGARKPRKNAKGPVAALLSKIRSLPAPSTAGTATSGSRRGSESMPSSPSADYAASTAAAAPSTTRHTKADIDVAHVDPANSNIETNTVTETKHSDGNNSPPQTFSDATTGEDDDDHTSASAAEEDSVTLLSRASNRPVGRRPVPLHNFRRLSMIDLRDVSEYQVPSEVKKRIAAAKKALVAMPISMPIPAPVLDTMHHASTVVIPDALEQSAKHMTNTVVPALKEGAATATAGAAAGAKIMTKSAVKASRGAVQISRSAKKSASKSAKKLRRRIIRNINAAGGGGGNGEHPSPIGARHVGYMDSNGDVEDQEWSDEVEEEVLTGHFDSFDGDEEKNACTYLNQTSSSDSLQGTRVVPSTSHNNNGDDLFFDRDEGRDSDVLLKEESFTYSKSPFDAMLKKDTEDEQTPPSSVDRPKATEHTSTEESYFESRLDPLGDAADSSESAQDTSIMTPMVKLGNVFDTMSLTGKKEPHLRRTGRNPEAPSTTTRPEAQQGSIVSSSSCRAPLSRKASSIVSVTSSSASQTAVSELLLEEDMEEKSLKASESCEVSGLVGGDSSKEGMIEALQIPKQDEDEASKCSSLTGNNDSKDDVVIKNATAHAIVAKDNGNNVGAGKTQDITVATNERFALVPSTYEFTPKEFRQPAVTQEALSNGSFLFSPNNMGRAALKQTILAANARRKSRSAIEQYIVPTKQEVSGLLKNIAHCSSSEETLETKGSKEDATCTKVSVSPETSTVGASITPETIDDNAYDEKLDTNSATPIASDASIDISTFIIETSTPQPVVSPASTAVSNTNSLDSLDASTSSFKPMYKESAVTSWKTKSPAIRFLKAKKKFSAQVPTSPSTGSYDEVNVGAGNSSIGSADAAEPLLSVGAKSTETDDADSFPSTDEVNVSKDTPFVEEATGIDDLEENCAAPTEEHSQNESKQNEMPMLQDGEEFHSQMQPSSTRSPRVQAASESRGVSTSVTDVEGRLKRNRVLQKQQPRRETLGEGVLAPRRSKLKNPLFTLPVPEDEATHYSENASTIASQMDNPISKQTDASDDKSEISSILSIARECVAISATNTSDRPSLHDVYDESGDEEDDEDDFSALVRSTVTSSSIIGGDDSTIATETTTATIQRLRPAPKARTVTTAKQRSVRWSEANQVCYTNDGETHPQPPQPPRSSRTSPSIVFDDDKENDDAKYQTPKPRLKASSKALVDPTAMGMTGAGGAERVAPSSGELCLSPCNRTPLQTRKWRQLAESAESNRHGGGGSSKKLKERLSSGKKSAKRIFTGKKTPLKQARERWEEKEKAL